MLDSERSFLTIVNVHWSDWFKLVKQNYTEKETQKGKYKNLKIKKSKRCEILKSNNRIIQKYVQICKRCEIVKSRNRIIQKSKS